MSHVTVQATLRATIIRSSAGAHGHEPIQLRFDPDDPLVITFTWPDGIEWDIYRSLLVHGGGVPGADVRVVRTPLHVLLALSSPGGFSELEFLRDEVDAVLSGAENLVPLDQAVPEHAIDAEIARILGTATP